MEDLLKRKVEDMNLEKVSFSDLIKQMDSSGGFSAKNLATAVSIIENMIKDKECIKFFSFPACIVSTGLRGAIAQAIEKGLFDIIVTTCGTLDHDLARAYGGKYFHGSFELDDVELHKSKINRLGNILIPNESYGIILEKKCNLYSKN